MFLSLNREVLCKIINLVLFVHKILTLFFWHLLANLTNVELSLPYQTPQQGRRDMCLIEILKYWYHICFMTNLAIQIGNKIIINSDTNTHRKMNVMFIIPLFPINPTLYSNFEISTSSSRYGPNAITSVCVVPLANIVSHHVPDWSPTGAPFWIKLPKKSSW